ncbi:MAG: thiamine diphosphokinase [Actinomycetes bacterium]
MREALVLAGGEPVDPRWHDEVTARAAAGAVVVAADSGIHHAHALDLAVAHLVGDLDSATAEAVARARAEGTPIEAHSTDKDATDLHLALDAARRAGATRVTVLGAGGGRHDHLLANALLLAADEFADLDLDACFGADRITVVRTTARLHGAPGDPVSLLAVGGPASGITTAGLRWPLRAETLEPGSSRGVSNEFTAPEAVVSLDAGTLLAIAPDPRST